MTETEWRPINPFDEAEKGLSRENEDEVKKVVKYMTVLSILSYFIIMLVFIPYG